MEKMKLLPLILALLALLFLSACTAAQPLTPQAPAEPPVIAEPVTEEPAVEETPETEEPAAEELPPAQPQCTVSVSCEELLANMELLAEEKHVLVPADGLLLPPTTVDLAGGESVFDVILSAVKANALHMEYTAGAATSYIEGVGNLYEFDAGPTAGWTYSVNGTFPSMDSGAYLVKDGDTVELVYSLTPKTGQ